MVLEYSVPPLDLTWLAGSTREAGPVSDVRINMVFFFFFFFFIVVVVVVVVVVAAPDVVEVVVVVACSCCCCVLELVLCVYF